MDTGEQIDSAENASRGQGFLIFDFSAKVICAFIAFKKRWKKNSTFSSTFLIRLRFQGYRCKSGIDILVWRV